MSPDVFAPEITRSVGSLIVIFSAGFLAVDMVAALAGHHRHQHAARRRIRAPIASFLLEISGAMERMAQRKMGALVVVERKDPLISFVSEGLPFDAEIRADVLVSLFSTASPVHDGAMIVSKGRIIRVKSILPLATKESLPMGIGTRHRSAIGITERTDAIALVVSEERGEMSVAYRGRLVTSKNQADLQELIYKAWKGKPLTLPGLAARPAGA